MLMNLRDRPLFGGCMFMNSRGGSLSGSASKNNFYGSNVLGFWSSLRALCIETVGAHNTISLSGCKR